MVGMAVIGRVSNVFESDDEKKRRWVWTTYGSDCLEGFLFDGVGACRERSATVRDEGRTCQSCSVDLCVDGVGKSRSDQLQFNDEHT